MKDQFEDGLDSIRDAIASSSVELLAIQLFMNADPRSLYTWDTMSFAERAKYRDRARLMLEENHEWYLRRQER